MPSNIAFVTGASYHANMPVLLALSLTHMDDAPRVKVNHDGLIDMSLTGGELVYAYASHMPDVRM